MTNTDSASSPGGLLWNATSSLWRRWWTLSSSAGDRMLRSTLMSSDEMAGLWQDLARASGCQVSSPIVRATR